VNELIEKLKQRGSNIVIRDVQRFSASTGGGHTPITHDGDPTGAIDATAYVMRRRSTFVNPITLSTRISNTALSTTTSVTGKTIEVPLEANNNKISSSSSYRESTC
jgi:hypothetical protein